MGWKTIVGTFLLAIGGACESLPEPFPTVGKVLIFVGTVFFGVGLRHAIAKGAVK